MDFEDGNIQVTPIFDPEPKEQDNIRAIKKSEAVAESKEAMEESLKRLEDLNLGKLEEGDQKINSAGKFNLQRYYKTKGIFQPSSIEQYKVANFERINLPQVFKYIFSEKLYFE